MVCFSVLVVFVLRARLCSLLPEAYSKVISSLTADLILFYVGVPIDDSKRSPCISMSIRLKAF